MCVRFGIDWKQKLTCDLEAEAGTRWALLIVLLCSLAPKMIIRSIISFGGRKEGRECRGMWASYHTELLAVGSAA